MSLRLVFNGAVFSSSNKAALMVGGRGDKGFADVL